MTVTILICTRNRAGSLAQTLESLASAQVPPGWSAELLVVDNASTDGTAGVVRAARLENMPVRYFHEARIGKCRSLNLGLSEARGEIILFTDDDVRVPPAWIEGMCRPILDGAADCVAGSVRLGETLRRPWQDEVIGVWLACGTPPVGDLWGVNMAVHRRVLERVPGFDLELGPGSLGNCEDSLFAMRLERAGFRMSVVPVEIRHDPDPARLEEADLVRAAANRGRSSAYVAYHWQQKTERFVTLRLGVLRAKRALRLFLSGSPDANAQPRMWLLFQTWHIHYLRHYRGLRGARPAYGDASPAANLGGMRCEA